MSLEFSGCDVSYSCYLCGDRQVCDQYLRSMFDEEGLTKNSKALRE